jgi:hypothetical protein
MARASRSRNHKQMGGWATHCHWHLSQVAPADTAGSFAGVSTVAMARSDDSVERGGSRVRRCLWLRRLREKRKASSLWSPQCFGSRAAS